MWFYVILHKFYSMYLKNGFDFHKIYDEEVRFNQQCFPEFNMPTFEQFVNFYENCPALGLMSNEVCIGAFIVHDRHLHMMICEAFRGKWAFLWPAAFKWALSISDPLYALMPVKNHKVINFIRAIGGQFEHEEFAYGVCIAHRYRLESVFMRYPARGQKLA